MRLQVALELSFGAGGMQQKAGLKMASDWAKLAAQTVRGRIEAAERDGAVLLEKRRLLTEKGPALWQQLFIRIQKMVEEFNAEEVNGVAMFYENLSTTKFSVRLHYPTYMKQLSVEFAKGQSESAIKWRYDPQFSSNDGEFSLSILPGGDVTLLHNTQHITPESASRLLMDGLIQK